MNYINDVEIRMNKAIDSLEEKFKNVRAGRANPNMLDAIMVSYYGTPTPIKQLGTVFVPEGRQLNIKPFDKSLIKDIEKAIMEANIGVTPNNNGELIYITIPALTEERRREFVKQIKEYAEEARIAIRNIRHDKIEEVKKDELPKDEEDRFIDQIQNIVNEFNKKVEEKTKEKEKSLMEI